MNYCCCNLLFLMLATSVTTVHLSSSLPSLLLLLSLLMLLLCGVGDLGSLKGYTCQHTVATYILSSAFSCVVELTTQLLRLISILWLPLCRINKLGYSYPRRLLRSPTLVGYHP